ncbi:MAG: sulfite exporter TauE/SafE family protein [Hyphomonadaceae bacterium]|jgi:uncharacterized membrane protein YfcA|nr:sulfite exporter TauE/SafE family protein [Hyphomonadaceae bacterium]
MSSAGTPERFYSVRRPLAAFCAGAAVAVLGGLIGLGGAEFRLPLLIAVFELYPHRAVRINLLISLATLAMAAAVRLRFTEAASVGHLSTEIAAMLAGGVVAAWIGAGVLARIARHRIVAIMAALLLAIAALLVAETMFAGSTALALPQDQALRAGVALGAGLLVGGVSSLLGVAGGELIIPILIFLFGADIKTAGTASVLVATPIVLVGVARHFLTGHYRSRSMLTHLVLPMSVGSLAGAVAGGLAAAWAPGDVLRIVLAVILAVSAIKLVVSQPRQDRAQSAPRM